MVCLPSRSLECLSYVSIEGNQEVMMKHTTLNLKERERERERKKLTHTQRTSRITIITEVSKIPGLMFCITTPTCTPTVQKTPQCQAFLGTLIFIRVVMECPTFIKLKFMLP